MEWTIIEGLLMPFIGTTAGAAMVFFLKGKISLKLQKIFTGFASGVMLAASFWSLLSPAIEQSQGMGRLAFLPSTIGFVVGALFLLVLDVLTPHMHLNKQEEGPKTGLKRTTKMLLAVTLHNIPEGMAVGVVLAGYIYGVPGVTSATSLALALGIALQNFPEGAIVAMPLRAEGMPKSKTFFAGMMSGIVEPIAGLLTLFAAGFVVPILPYLLSFAAGAMIYVVVDELIPSMSEGEHTNTATISFVVGFVIMMILDVALG